MSTRDREVLHHLIGSRAHRTPNDVALREVTGRALTWREVELESLRWAQSLRRAGVGPGDPVLTMLPNSIDAHLLWLAVSRLRAIEVPVNNEYRGSMLEHIIRDSTSQVAVIADAFLPRFTEIEGLRSQLRLVVDVGPPAPDRSGAPPTPFALIDVVDFLAAVEANEDLPAPSGHDIAAMIYTSGTTGASKGVLVPWSEMSTFSDGTAEAALPPGGITYSPFPACHITGKNAFMTVAKYREGLVLRERFSVSSFWDDIRAFSCTSGMLVGGMAALLMGAPPQADDRDHPLRYVTVGPLMPNLADFERRFNLRVATSYGMTEIGLPLASPGWDLPNTLTCGRLKPGYPGYAVRVVDEFDTPLPAGEAGELVVRADEAWVISAGYYGRPQMTADAWRNGWFHTGDAFRYDEDGWFYFVDRMKDALRRRGENISSFEVEAYVNQHPGVSESAVIAVESEFGEDDIKVVVVPRSGQQALTAEELMRFLVPRMPRFMLPRYIEFVTEIPKTQATLRQRKFELRAIGLTPSTWDREAAGFKV